MPELDTVFINVSYFAFFRDNTHVDLTYFQTRRTHLYMVAPPSTPIDGDKGRFLLAKTQPIAPIMAVLREDNWYGVFTNLVNGSVVEASQSPEAATDDAAPVCEHQPPQQLEEHGYATAIRHLDVTDRVLQQNADVALKAYATWSETISQLQANNIEVVLYTPPYFASYSYFFETEGGAQQLDTTQQLTAQLADKFEIDYYDFSAEPTIINDHTLFADSDHLNECGSEAFTELIAAAWQANR